MYVCFKNCLFLEKKVFQKKEAFETRVTRELTQHYIIYYLNRPGRGGSGFSAMDPDTQVLGEAGRLAGLLQLSAAVDRERERKKRELIDGQYYELSGCAVVCALAIQLVNPLKKDITENVLHQTFLRGSKLHVQYNMAYVLS